MTKRFLLKFLLFLCLFANAQKKQITRVVADKMSKQPLEKVNVFNEKDNSLTNQEGVFSFISEVDELNFSLIGYKDIKIDFDGIKKLDTIFMQPLTIELDEVIVGNELSIIKKAYSKVKENYALEPYNENFFLRFVLKRDAEIVRLQDVYGIVSRNSIFKTNKQPDNKCEVEILNMRKTNISEKKNIEYFEFQSFEKMFDLNALITISIDKFELTQEKTALEEYIKISFISKEESSIGQKMNGYFIINKDNYAIVETYFDFYSNTDKIPYQKDGKIQFRTTNFKRTSNYKKSNLNGKYYLSNSNSDFSVEVKGKEKNDSGMYDCSTVFFVTNSFTGEKAKANVSINKDIFKIKFPYSEQFWSRQNQLPLTTELKEFLKRVAENKDNKKNFEVIGNF